MKIKIKNYENFGSGPQMVFINGKPFILQRVYYRQEQGMDLEFNTTDMEDELSFLMTTLENEPERFNNLFEKHRR